MHSYVCHIRREGGETVTPDRSKIIIEHEDHIKYWTRHFGVTKDELTRAFEMVGDSAAAVRKQLGVVRQDNVLAP